MNLTLCNSPYVFDLYVRGRMKIESYYKYIGGKACMTISVCSSYTSDSVLHTNSDDPLAKKIVMSIFLS